jgi:amidase
MDNAAIWIRRLDEGDDDDDGDGGIRLGVKDCIDVAGVPTTVGCPVIAEQAGPATADATVVVAARKAGARIVGKTNLTELCWSAVGTNSWSGTPLNPVDPRRLPGGSSSGSAVAVAVGEADVALGTDTGGSIRIPAACCGVVGLKTTWGRVPLAGVYPLSPSLDTVGPLGADVAAVELGMRLIDPSFDPEVAAQPVELAVGRLRPATEINPVIDAAIDQALAAAGVVSTEVAGADNSGLDFAAVDAMAGAILDSEGYRSNEALLPHLDRLAPFVQRNMAAGGAIAAADIAAAHRSREALRAWFDALLGQYGILAMPTLIGAPPLLGERMSLTRLTMPVNLAGLPALALPVPGGPDGLPASLQLIGPANSEERLIALARAIEAALAVSH